MKVSCAHFVMKNKAAMLEAYESDVIPAEEIAAFRKLIAIPGISRHIRVDRNFDEHL